MTRSGKLTDVLVRAGVVPCDGISCMFVEDLKGERCGCLVTSLRLGRVIRELAAAHSLGAPVGQSPIAWGDIREFTSDDADLADNRLGIYLGGNGDWYVQIRRDRARAGLAVRIRMSGGAAAIHPGLGVAVSRAYRALGNEPIDDDPTGATKLESVPLPVSDAFIERWADSICEHETTREEWSKVRRIYRDKVRAIIADFVKTGGQR